MSKRSAIDLLPDDVRMELANGLKGSGWGNIDGWTEWLNGKGFEISRSVVGKFNKRKKDQFEQAWADAEQTAAMARIMVANNSDDGGAVLKANEMLASDGLLRMQTALRELEQEIGDMKENEETAADAVGLTFKLADSQAKMIRASAELTKAGVTREKWMQQIRADERLRAIEDAAKAAGEAGASVATIERIRDILEKGG